MKPDAGARKLAADSLRGVRVRQHSKAEDANLEVLDRLAGIVELSGPAPSGRFLDTGDNRHAVGAGH